MNYHDVSVSRRRLLGGGVAAIAALGVAACSPAQVQNFETQWASVASQVQQFVASAAKYVPTVESIAATAASLFGPQYAAIVTVGSSVFNQLVQALVNVVANISPPAKASLRARLSGSSPGLPIEIGVTATGVVVTGWHS